MKYKLLFVLFAAIVFGSFSPKTNIARNPIGKADPNSDPPSFTFKLLPGEKVTFKMSYHGYFSHTTGITEGSYKKNFNKKQGDEPQSFNYERDNRTTQAIEFRIMDSAVLSESRGPNLDNVGTNTIAKKTYIRVHEERDNYVKIGWEDFTDADFDDALVEIIIGPLEPDRSSTGGIKGRTPVKVLN